MHSQLQSRTRAARSRGRLATAGAGVVVTALLTLTGCSGSSPTARQPDSEPNAEPSTTSTATSAPTPTPTPDSKPAAATCDPVTADAVDASSHVDGRAIRYTAAPPSYGDHRSRWAVLAPNFYTVETRPEVAVLVHNLEHGYNILWYDETVVRDRDALARVRRLANSYDGARRDPDTALIAAPWIPSDGRAFPSGRHYALTHWYADPDDSTNSRDDELGYTQYCTQLTSEAVARWMKDYPLRNSPEGFRAAM
jgi:hypothetical protein